MATVILSRVSRIFRVNLNSLEGLKSHCYNNLFNSSLSQLTSKLLIALIIFANPLPLPISSPQSLTLISHFLKKVNGQCNYCTLSYIISINITLTQDFHSIWYSFIADQTFYSLIPIFCQDDQ